MLLQFPNVFARYVTDFEWIPEEGGHYDFANGGTWKSAAGDPVPMRGIILPLSDDDLRFDPGGTYTQHDRKIYVRKPAELATDGHVRYAGEVYRILSARPYAYLTDFNAYIAKRVDTKGRDPIA